MNGCESGQRGSKSLRTIAEFRAGKQREPIPWCSSCGVMDSSRPSGRREALCEVETLSEIYHTIPQAGAIVRSIFVLTNAGLRHQNDTIRQLRSRLRDRYACDRFARRSSLLSSCSPPSKARRGRPIAAAAIGWCSANGPIRSPPACSTRSGPPGKWSRRPPRSPGASRASKAIRPVPVRTPPASQSYPGSQSPGLSCRLASAMSSIPKNPLIAHFVPRPSRNRQELPQPAFDLGSARPAFSGWIRSRWTGTPGSRNPKNPCSTGDVPNVTPHQAPFGS